MPVIAVCSHLDVASRVKADLRARLRDQRLINSIQVQESTKGHGFCVVGNREAIKSLGLTIKTNLDHFV